MIEAKIIADSICNGNRITTFELKYPRFILAEFNTHRMFSRSSASSRAIPIKKVIKEIIDNPATPVYWGKNKPGMQANEELSGIDLFLAKLMWKSASFVAIAFSYGFYQIGLHKQISNRILEPWQHSKTIVTATDWNNFFELRCHTDAQPEMFKLAFEMKEAYNISTPKKLSAGSWHIPYIHDWEREEFSIADCLKMSSARCARVSYNNHDGSVPDIKKDFTLHDQLVGSNPKHMSPTEHQASAAMTPYESKKYYGNFKGWKQYRWFIENSKDVEYKI
jgi:hypothetical protein